MHLNPRKRHIAQQFSRAAKTYEQAASIQATIAEQLLTYLGPIKGHWLDIGCGSGRCLQALLNAGADSVTGVDFSEAMLDQARQNFQQHPRVQLLAADADQLPWTQAKFDGIFSNLMLQWSPNLNATLQHWQAQLKPGATLALATLLSSTHQELRTAWQAVDRFTHVNRFLTFDEFKQAASSLNALTLVAEEQQYQEEFSHLTLLLQQLKAIGATNTNPGRAPGLGGRQALIQLEEAYPRTPEGTLPLTYHAGYLVAQYQTH